MLEQTFNIDGLLAAVGNGILMDIVREDTVEHRLDNAVDILVLQDVVALLIHRLALLAQDIVVVKQCLTDIEVDAFNTFLGTGDRLGDHLVFDRLIAHLVEEALDPFASETDHQIVLEGDIEAGETRIALTAGTTAQLVIDTAALVTLGTENGQTAEFPGFGGQLDIGTTAGHVGGDGQRADLACLGDDLRFTGMVLGVQDFVTDLAFLQHLGDEFGSLDRDRADEDRLALGMQFNDLVDQSLVFCLLCTEDKVRTVVTDDRTVGRDDHDLHVVDIQEFLFLGLGGTGHTGELVVETEEVLVGDRSQSGRFLTDRNIFLGLDRLMQTIGVLTARHLTAGVLVNDDDLFILNDVFNVLVHDVVGFQRLADVVDERGVVGVVEVLDLEELLAFGNALLRQLDVSALDIDDIVLILFQTADETVRADIFIGGLSFAAGNDQRCARFIDQDGVDFIDESEVQLAQYAVFDPGDHVVAQIVETDFRVGRIGDVAVIGFALFGRRHRVFVEADGQTEEAMDLSHPLAVTFRQIFVDGDDVHAVSGQRVQVDGHDGSQGLAFTGLHLGDIAAVQDIGAFELTEIRVFPDDTLGRFTGDCEGIRQDVIQRFAGCQFLAEFSGHVLKIVILHLRVLRGEVFDRTDSFLDRGEILLVRIEQFI